MSMELYECVQYQEKETSRQLKIEKERLLKFPEGHLKFRRRCGHVRYFQVIPGSGKRKHAREFYLSKKKQEVINGLAAKQLCIWRIEDLTRELKAEDQYLKLCKRESASAEEKWEKNKELHELVNFSVLTGQEGREWAQEPYERSNDFSDRLKFRTLCGIYVRSKSEALIANILTLKGIPFRYEMLLKIGNMQFAPDFTVKNIRTGQIFYLEHFGMMDNQAYLQKTITKLNMYLSNGFVPGVNFIATFETADAPLDSLYVGMLADIFFR